MPPLQVADPFVVGAGFTPALAPKGRQMLARIANPGLHVYEPGMRATGAGMMFQVNPERPSGWV
jgi:hypothetical protein